MTTDKQQEKDLGEASYNIEDCRDVSENVDDVADNDEDSATVPKDLDECKPITK